jgi:hypothetical protein
MERPAFGLRRSALGRSTRSRGGERINQVGIMSRMTMGKTAGVAFVAALLLAVSAGAGDKVKVTVQKAKDFQFGGRHAYAWHPEEPVSVKILQALGDPEKLKAYYDPKIRPLIEQALANRGFTKVAADQADFFVCYYVLIGPDVSSQYHGQFVGAIPEWGLPDFLMSTSALKVVDQGSIVVDVMSKELKATIWRGIAASQIQGKLNDTQRMDRIDKAFGDMFKDFPPKDQKPK